MTVPARDWRRLAADLEEDQALRLAVFRAAYPFLAVSQGEFGTWHGLVGEADGETIIVRHTLRELLDRLAAVLGEPPR